MRNWTRKQKELRLENDYRTPFPANFASVSSQGLFKIYSYDFKDISPLLLISLYRPLQQFTDCAMLYSIWGLTLGPVCNRQHTRKCQIPIYPYPFPLPAANEDGGRQCFHKCLSVILSTRGGNGYLWSHVLSWVGGCLWY